jgi:hypothetical protein
MATPSLSKRRLKRKVLHVAADANFLSDEIAALANQAKSPRQALQLAARAHQIAIDAVGPDLFGHVFQADEDEAHADGTIPRHKSHKARIG